MIQYFYKFGLRAALLLSILLCLFPGLASTEAGEGSAKEATALTIGGERLQRLESGEVIVDEQAESADGASVVAWIFIHAPVQRVWETIISCVQAERFVAGLRLCQVIEETGDYALTRQIVDKGWSTPRLDYTFSTKREPYRRMQVELASGNLRTLKGDWIFESMNDGVLLQHRIELRPLAPVPRWLVRRNLRKDLPAMLTCIRGLVSGSGTHEASAHESAQCPGSKG